MRMRLTPQFPVHGFQSTVKVMGDEFITLRFQCLLDIEPFGIPVKLRYHSNGPLRGRTPDIDTEGLKGVAQRIVYSRCFKTAVEHAVCAFTPAARAVCIPIRFFHEGLISGRMPVCQKIARLLPA